MRDPQSCDLGHIGSALRFSATKSPTDLLVDGNSCINFLDPHIFSFSKVSDSDLVIYTYVTHIAASSKVLMTSQIRSRIEYLFNTNIYKF